MSKTDCIPEGNKEIGAMKDEISLSPVEKKEGAMSLFSRLLRLDLTKRSAPEPPASTEPPATYYGVYIPCEIKKGPDEKTIHVYKNKSEALDVMKKYKTSRFKAFPNHQDAVYFALRGAESNDTHDGNSTSFVGEKPYPFKAPSPQEMVSLRKSIEAGLVTTVRDRVWNNPRYLVSSGNTPTILHEGSRYNALHVAAKAKNAEMCDMLLTTVGDPAFVQALYGGDSDYDNCKEFASILVDRYLNTPDKGLNESAIHFACKFGAADVVDVLTSFPQCNINVVNKHGQKPADIICSRSGDPLTASKISSLLMEKFYVPVLHCTDDSAPPAVGQAFTPRLRPELNKDPLSPQMEIRAFAGPMPQSEAETFRRLWRTPPRTRNSLTIRRGKNILAPGTFRLADLTKGLECVGRNLAQEKNVGWKEYWPFLDTFTDLRTEEGLALLENYLKSKYEVACSIAYSDSCLEHTQQPSPEELSISRISINTSQMSPPKEGILSPMSELCVAMKTCSLNNERPAHWRKTDPIRQRMCRQATKLNQNINGNSSPPTNHTVSQLMCIERTCQVFAKRIADALIFSLTSEPEVAGESLKSEAKHLQHTMHTYMDDVRFKDINFSLIHSRLAQLVVFKLKQRTKDLEDINSLVEFLVKLRCPNDDIFSSDDERNPAYRGPSNRLKLNTVINSHVRCLSSFISEDLYGEEGNVEVNRGPSVGENECTEVWDKASKCNCDWKMDLFERNSKKSASFRKNRSEQLSMTVKSDSFVKRLSFDHDMGDSACHRPESSKPISINSGGGDSAADEAPRMTPTSTPTSTPPTHFTVHMDKCHVVPAEISDDDSIESCNSDVEEEAYHTASEHSDRDDNMLDASDRAIADAFIYGEEPTKMDRLVYDCIQECEMSREQFPNIYRWRHTIGLYSQKDREAWPSASLTPPSPTMSPSLSLGQWSPGRRGRRPLRSRARPLDHYCSTPKKEIVTSTEVGCGGGNVPLQVSNWLRVTGPNSPKCVIEKKNISHNVSFGF